MTVHKHRPIMAWRTGMRELQGYADKLSRIDLGR